ncbi:MAG: DMT family transporter [Alphaproteobacteria bacterium]|nr:DMT family transporter [Alphaproteobacteria bacterium]
MTVRRDRLDLGAIALLLVVAAAIGGQQTAIKFAGQGAAPLFLAGLRAAAAALCLAALVAARGGPLLRRDETRGPGVLIGCTGAIQFALLFVALEYTTAARATVFMYAAPLLIAGAAHLFVPGERMRPAQFAGLAIAFLGLPVAFADRLGEGGMGWLGDALAFAAAFAWAATVLVMRASALIEGDPARTLFYQMGFSAPILFAFSAVAGEEWTIAPTMPAVLGFAYLVGAVVCFGFVAWTWLLARYPAADVAAFSFFTPVFGVAAGALALDESLGLPLLLGLALVSAGIVLVSRRPPR